jgi:hypothetical protein
MVAAEREKWRRETMVFLWACTGLGSVLGVLILMSVLATAKGAPQEAAGAAIALCCAVLPYVFTRAFEAVSEGSWRRELLEAQRKSAADYRTGTESLLKQLASSTAGPPHDTSAQAAE